MSHKQPTLEELHTKTTFDPNKMSNLLLSNMLKKLEAREREIRMLADNISDVLIHFDHKGRFIYTNQRFKTVFGITLAEIRGKKPTDGQGLPDTEFFEQTLLRIIETGVAESFVHETTLPDGRIRTGVVNATPEHDEQGSVLYVQLLIRDITEQKRMEKSLRETNKRFTQIYDNSIDVIYLIEVTPEGQFIYRDVNAAYETITEISREAVIGVDVEAIENETFREILLDKFNFCLKRGEKCDYVNDYPFPSGTRTFHSILTPMFDEEGRIYQIVGVARDITEQKEGEKRLQLALEFNEEVMSTIPDLMFELDAEGVYKNIWAQDEKLLAAQKKHLLGKNIRDILSHDAVEVSLQMMGEVDATGQSLGNIMYVDLPEGRKYFELSASMRKSSGTYIVLSRDITERKRSEEALAISEREFRSLAENTPDNIARWDSEGRYLYINPVHERTMGKSAAEIIGTFVPDAHEAVKAAIAQVAATGEKIMVRQSVLNEKGEMEFHDVNIVAEKDPSGKVISVLGIGRDITEQKRAEEQLQKTKAKLSAIITAIPDLIWVKDANGVYMMCNPPFENFFGAPSDEIIGKTDYDFISREQADFFRQKDAEALASGEICINEEEIIFAHNSQFALLETRKVPVYDGEEFMGVLGIGRDITERKRMELKILQNQSRLNEAQKIAKVGSWELEFPGLELSWSDEIYRIFEIEPNSFQPSYDHFLNIAHPEDRVMIDYSFHKSLQNKTPYDMVHRLLMSDGRIKYVHERGESVYNPDGIPIRSIGTVQDVTEQKTIEKQIEHIAHHDPLTDLPNRILVKDRSDRAIAYAKRNHTKTALLFIDLDEFKVINDSLGHSLGDEILKQIAVRLGECLRETDTLSRLGGDEFIVILSSIADEDDVTLITNKLLKTFDVPFEIADHHLSVSGSIGIALYPDHGDSFDSLLQNADAAMYKAKELGKNGYCFYSQKMNHNIIGLFKMRNDLRSALEFNEFILHYQPQIDLATGTIIGAEALIRWNHPQLGMTPPMSFIPIAESSGLIVQIGEWVLHEACRQVSHWQKIGIGITVAVNISAIQFKRGNLESVVKSALASSQIDPKQLELELTESIIMHDTDNTLQSVRNLKALGVQLSIDDFGTGYSSLAYLKRFAVDKLKIDQSFVRDILCDQEDAVIVETIIQMAKSLNLKTIAEGVEDAQVLSVVESFGCDEVQGYHFAKPLEASAFEHYYTHIHTLKESL